MRSVDHRVKLSVATAFPEGSARQGIRALCPLVETFLRAITVALRHDRAVVGEDFRRATQPSRKAPFGQSTDSC